MMAAMARGSQVVADRRIETAPREDGLLSLNEAAAYLGIWRGTLSSYAEESVVPGFKLGSRWRFSKTALDGWISRQGKKGSGR